MSTTKDWLAELRESKRQAIARVQAESDELHTASQTIEERLQAEQSRLATLIQDTQIEPLLQEFCVEILVGHPNFVGYSLSRTVRSRAADSPVEYAESAPWTSPVENNSLSPDWKLGNGRYVSGVEWKLQSNYHSTHGHELRPFRIVIATTAAGVKIDGQPLSAPTAENFKKALLEAFKATLHALSRRRSRRRHRPWYQRLLSTTFPAGRLSSALVAGSIVVILLSMALAIHIAQVIGLRP